MSLELTGPELAASLDQSGYCPSSFQVYSQST